MQKAKVLCLILAMVMASVGTVVVAQNFGDNTDVPIDLPVDDLNMYLEKPASGDPSQFDLKENLYIAAGELKRSGGFVGVSSGTTTSVGMAQEVSNKRTVVNGNVFKEMATAGVVKNAYQLYLYGDNYLYRKPEKISSVSSIRWSDSAQKYTQDSFMSKFGHRSDALTGYILNDETITDAYVEKIENGLFSYRYILDINKAPVRMLYEMRANSGMSGFSTFEKAEIIVTMDADWHVKTLRTDCKYKVPMLGGLDCIEDITETFSDIGYQGDLPEKEFFEQFFDASAELPIEGEQDALTVLMSIFQPYLTGEKLNLSLSVAMDDTEIVSALISANIDINNFDNITADVKVGTDLYLSYQAGKLFVTYQDFKGSTTLDGIMGLVNAFLPKQDGSQENTNDAEVNEDDITSKFTYTIEDGRCIVNMPITLGNLSLEANIYANVKDGEYEFVGADAKLGDVTVDVKPVGQFDVPARTGDYPEILGLLDLINNGVINANVNAFGMSVDVMFDLQSMSLYAQSGDLSVVFSDNVAYLTVGGAKLKLAVDDIQELLDVIGLFIDGGIDVAMPEISIDTILAMLGNIKAVSANGQTAFMFELGDLSASINLVPAKNGWNIESIKLDYNGIDVAVTPVDKFAQAIPTVDATEYADVTDIVKNFAKPIADLIKGESYGVEFSVNLGVNGNQYVLSGDLAYDKAGNIQVNALIGNGNSTYVNANVVVANNTVYLAANGIKAAFALPQSNTQIDIAQIANQLKGIDDNVDALIDQIMEIVSAVTQLDLAKLDFAKLISNLTYDENNGRLDVAINAEDLAIGTFNVGIAVVDGKLSATIGGLSVANVSLDVTANVQIGVADIVIPNADDYVTELQIDVAGITAYVQLDLYNGIVRAHTVLYGQDVVLLYANGKAYVTYGNIKAYVDVNDIDRLLAVVGKFVNIDGGLNLNVHDIINSLTLTEFATGFNASVAIGSVNAEISFNAINDGITFDNAIITTGDVSIVARLTSGHVYPEIVADNDFVNLTDLVEAFADEIANLINAQGYAVNANGSIVLDSKTYGIQAEINYNGGLFVKAALSLDGVLMANAEIYLVDNTLYADIAGVKLAVGLNTISGDGVSKQSLQQTLEQFFGYNDYLDTVLNLVIDVASKAHVEDISKLINSLTFDGNVLNAEINGSVYGLSQFNVSVAQNSGLSASISGIKYGNIELNVNADFSASDRVITAPYGDYSTNISIRIDDKNVIYANIDLLTGVFRFRIGDLYAVYADNTIKINYNNELFVTGDVSYILAKIKEIDDLVNEFAGADKSEISEKLSLLESLDIKSIIKSIAVSSNITANTGKITLTAFNMPITVNLADGMIDNVTIVTKKSNSANKPDDTIVVSLTEAQSYYEFTGNENYVVIEEVFEDYFETFKKLVHTNSWRFDFNKQSEIAIGKDNYALAAGSYVEFYYKNTESDQFKLRANIVLLKMNATTKKWEQFITLDAVYVDGSIYVTYNGKLKATVSKDTLMDCYNEVLPELTRVIPQIGDLIKKIGDAMTEVKDENKVIDFSTILRSISYKNGVFSLTVNGGVILSNLGDISIMVSQTANGLSLDALSLVYDSINVNIEGMTVVASDKVTVDGQTQYVAVNDILAYDRTGHIDLNSLKQLLLAFIKTADMKTQDADGNEVRSFYVNGTIKADLAFTGTKGLTMVSLDVSVKVDINAQGKTFLTLKLSHGNNRIVFKDYGADSYLYYSGDTRLISLVRNAKTGLFSGKKIDYQKTGMTFSEFQSDMINYILELVNFSDVIEKPIRDSITSGGSNNSYGIEDIIKDYSYAQEYKTFALQADLSPIDKNLGLVNVNIIHDDNYNLTNVNGNIKLVSVLSANFDLKLGVPTYGASTNHVLNTELW